MANNLKKLDLARLSGGSPPGITPAMGQLSAEAASVLLEHNQHSTGVNMEVAHTKRSKFSLLWPALHADARRNHNDLPAAAEIGAVGIAILLVEELTELRIVERSAKGSGIDYWLGDGKEFMFQKTARLEVSGIIDNPDALESRVKAKLRQTDASAGKLPAFVAVVEFGQPKSAFVKR